MDDLIQLLVFVAVVFFSLLAGGKKRGQKRRPPRPARPHPVEPRELPSAPRVRARSEGPAPRAQVAEDLLEILSGRVPESLRAVEARARRRVPAPPEVDDEAQSLESLEEEGSAAHQRFHERYVDQHAVPTTTSGPRGARRITPSTAREAVIWRTIISPPKSME